MQEFEAGSTVLGADGSPFVVSDALAAAYRPGDRLVANAVAGLLHIPAAELNKAAQAVEAATGAFAAMRTVPDEAVVAFYGEAAAKLADDNVWQRIAETNAGDVEAARQRGRSTTRLAVSRAMREKMIEGLAGWAAMPSRRGALLETVPHTTFRIDLVGAALGVVAFVFEGRPNVLADACGVLRGGNTVVFRIGGDALGTAKEIMETVIAPALASAGLPAGAVALVDSTAHAAGWALFLDSRLALAVARGSGTAVETLGSLARAAGTPVSLHGAGGAWLMASESAGDEELRAAVLRSLDRKVCNTLNTCCLIGMDARRRASIVLDALRAAGRARQQAFKLHVAEGSEHLVPASLFSTDVCVIRGSADRIERQAETLPVADLGTEWEWEETPEITIAAFDRLDRAVTAFNRLSPKLVATLISADAAEQDRFFATIDSPFVGDGHTRWVDGQFALGKPELGLSNWQSGRLFGRGAVLTGDSVYTVRTRYTTKR